MGLAGLTAFFDVVAFLEAGFFSTALPLEAEAGALAVDMFEDGESVLGESLGC